MTREVSLTEAWRMSKEVRHWWIEQMRKDQEPQSQHSAGISSDGRTIVRGVPRGPRGE